MAFLGVGLAWVSYATILWGYCLIRGYDITVTELMKPTWPPDHNPASTPSQVQEKTPA